MSRSKHHNRRQGLIHVTILVAVLTVIGAAGNVSAQWTTNGSNINNTNSGNVGVGTSSPSARLTVQGPVPSGVTDIFRVLPGATFNNNSLFSVASIDTAGGARAATRMTIYGDNAGNVGSLVLDWYGNAGTLYGPNGLTFYANAAITGGSPRAFVFRSVDLSPFGSPNAVLAVQNASGSDLFLVTQGGDVSVAGNIAARYQDIAEWVSTRQKLVPGTVVVLDAERGSDVVASSVAYDTKVAGVISAKPGLALGESAEDKVLVATTGRVRVKVDATRAPIRVGDLLVTSSTPGYAMKSEPIVINGRSIHSPGTLIGKALEGLEKGTGEIMVLLSLQ